MSVNVEEIIDSAVNRFLGWELPDFHPDGGITFNRIPNHKAVGTNLFSAQEAKEMFEYVLTEALTQNEARRREEERERIMPWVEHDNQCILQQDQRGEPTEDGGYRRMYAGVWYKSGEEPKCDCGLAEALTPKQPL